MYIVNTSFMVEPPAHDRWYELVTGKVIPHLQAAGFGDRVVFTRVLAENPEGHYTYSLQVEIPDIETSQRFMREVVGEYASLAGALFGEQVLYFSSLLKKIETPGLN